MSKNEKTIYQELYENQKIRTKPRDELKPLWLRIKDYRNAYMQKLLVEFVDGDAISLVDLKALLKVGPGTIYSSIRDLGYACRKIKDDNDEWWLFIDHASGESKK